jgi:release factor glutamine methyltransferase
MSENTKYRSNILFNHVKTRLSELFGENEATSIAFLLFEKIFELKRAEILAGKSLKLFNKYCFEELENFTNRLLDHEPIQYILQEAYFYNWTFFVSPSVLIPRPETEELVHLVLKENVNLTNPKILDIGTGSGCIAISLAKERQDAEVHALDISKEALEVARQNAQKIGAKIYFSQADILSGYLDAGGFDILISNPPYVLQKEKSTMAAHVLDHEPHKALFVPDNDPLKFYKAIVTFSKSKLKPNGKIYFEINEQFPEETKKLMEENGFVETEIVKDLNGKCRIAKGVKV